MDRNSILGILLIAAILIVWGVVQKPNKKNPETGRNTVDTTAIVANKSLPQDTAKTISPTVTKTKSDTANAINLVNQYGEYAKLATGEQKFYSIENDLIKLVISSKGGRPYSVELKKYKTFGQKPIVLFSGDSTQFGLTYINKNNIITTNNLYFQSLDTTAHIFISNSDDSIIMRLAVEDNKYMEYRYIVHPNSYMIDFNMHLVGMKDIISRNIAGSLDMNWMIYVPQQEQQKKNENLYTTIDYRNYKADVNFLTSRTNKSQKDSTLKNIEWVAFKDQFFSSLIIAADTGFTNGSIASTILPPEDKFLKKFNAAIGLPFNYTNNETIRMKMFFGPNKFNLLKQYKQYDLQDLVSVGKGIIRWINKYVIITIFDWLSRFIVNYGIIILLLTIIIKIALLPLTYRSYLSQAKMRILKPQIDELTHKYPKGKEVEKQQATMALYKKAGVSPLGGCLPMLLQFPILFAMFRFFPTSIELRQHGFLWAKDLSTYDSILSWHATIPFLSSVYGNHISLFTLLMTISTIISAKMTDTSGSSQQMPGMKSMMYVMPVMFMFILNNFSSGLTYYYFLTNVISIGQNYLFKQFIDEDALLKKMQERKAKTVKKSNFQKRLEDMAKKRGYTPPKKK